MSNKNSNDTEYKVLLIGGISEDVDLSKRADILYDHKSNNKAARTAKIINAVNTGLKTLSAREPDYENFCSYNTENFSDIDLTNNQNYYSGLHSQKDLDKKYSKPESKIYVKEVKVPSISKINTQIAPVETLKPGLINKTKRTINKGTFEASNYIIDKEYDSVGTIGARMLGGYETDENLKMSLAENYLNTPYAKQNTVYNSVNEVPDFLQSFVKHKVKEQLGPEYINTIKGIFIDNDTETAKRLAKNNDILLYIKRNKDFLKDYGYIKKGSIQFTDNNFYNAIGKADIIDVYLNENNEIVLYILDTYDFNKDSLNPFVRAGRINQDNKRILPYFIIYSVKIDKYTTERILR